MSEQKTISDLGDQCFRCKVKGLIKTQNKAGTGYYFLWMGSRKYHDKDECMAIQQQIAQAKDLNEKMVVWRRYIDENMTPNPDVPQSFIDEHVKKQETKEDGSIGPVEKETQKDRDKVNFVNQLVKKIDLFQNTLEEMKKEQHAQSNNIYELQKIIKVQNEFMEANVKGMNEIANLALKNSFQPATSLIDVNEGDVQEKRVLNKKKDRKIIDEKVEDEKLNEIEFNTDNDGFGQTEYETSEDELATIDETLEE